MLLLAHSSTAQETYPVTYSGGQGLKIVEYNPFNNTLAYKTYVITRELDNEGKIVKLNKVIRLTQFQEDKGYIEYEGKIFLFEHTQRGMILHHYTKTEDITYYGKRINNEQDFASNR